mgnify:CR=1 FL=1
MSNFEALRRPERSEKPHQMRRRGWIPMALVTRDHSTTLLQAKSSEVQKALKSLDGHGRIGVSIEGEKGAMKVIVKQVDNSPLFGGILNVTLQEVSDKDVVKLDVPVVAIGHSEEAEGKGVVLTQPTTHIKLQGKMADLPAHIEVDVSKINVGEHINAGDIELPDGIKLVSSADATLFGIQVLRAVSLQPEGVEETATETEEEAETPTEG